VKTVEESSEIPVTLGQPMKQQGLPPETRQNPFLVCPPFYEERERIDAAWGNGFTGQGVIVAVLDVGVDIDHLELQANVVSY